MLIHTEEKRYDKSIHTGENLISMILCLEASFKTPGSQKQPPIKHID